MSAQKTVSTGDAPSVREHIEQTEGPGDWCENTEDCDPHSSEQETEVSECSGFYDRGDDGEWRPTESDNEDPYSQYDPPGILPSWVFVAPDDPRIVEGGDPGCIYIPRGTCARNLLEDE